MEQAHNLLHYQSATRNDFILHEMLGIRNRGFRFFRFYFFENRVEFLTLNFVFHGDFKFSIFCRRGGRTHASHSAGEGGGAGSNVFNNEAFGKAYQGIES